MPRTSRQRPKRTWIVIGVVGTLMVLVVNTIVRAATDEVGVEVSRQSYADQLRPLLSESQRSATDLARIFDNPTSANAESLVQQARKEVERSAQVLRYLDTLVPPKDMQASDSLARTVLFLRNRAAKTIEGSVGQINSSVSVNSLSTQLYDAGLDLVAADRSLQVLDAELQRLSVATGMPNEQTVQDQVDWDMTIIASNIETIRNQSQISLTPDLQVLLVGFDPPPIRSEGDIQVLSQAPTLKTQIVVANMSVVEARNVQVTATLTPKDATPGDSARDFVSLAPGARATITLGGLKIQNDVENTFTASIESLEGEQNSENNVKSQMIKMSTPGR